jgi:hypothetical protein
MLEKHYTCGELAKMWGFSNNFVRKLFKKEEGVLMVERPERMHSRGRVLLRIPESVAERVYSRLVRMKRPTLRSATRAAQLEAAFNEAQHRKPRD